MHRLCWGGELGSGVFSNQIEFFRRRGKLRTKVRMRQLDQSLRALGRRLALEVRPRELSSYDVRVDARRRDWPLPPREAYAPRTKSSCPPLELYWWPSMCSALTAPVKSICKAALIEITLSF